MLNGRGVVAVVIVAVTAVASCTNDPGINAATGGLVGAAVGSQFGEGRGRTAATLGGAAAGMAIGGNVPTTRMCTYRNTSTGATYQAACPSLVV
jgi:uncharacterized protein YcfJ